MAPNFEHRAIADALEMFPRHWLRAASDTVPDPWMKAYLKPIRVALGGFAAVTAVPLLEAWGVIASEELRLGIRSRHCMEVPNLPWARLRAVEGGVAQLRSNRADLVLVRCNGCGAVHPSHWLETADDERRAHSLERRHPALLAIARGAAVTRFSTYEGCYCGFEDGSLSAAIAFDGECEWDPRLGLDDLADSEEEPDETALAREIAARARAIRERCVDENGKEAAHARRRSA